MTTKFYIDANGAFLGGFGDGAEPPEGAVEVMVEPPSGTAVWQDGAWAEVQPVPASITFAQLMIGLVAEGWISEAEGEGWLQGTLPAGAQALIATLPEPMRFSARARATRPSEVLRSDPVVILMATAIGKADELDAFFRTYSAV